MSESSHSKRTLGGIFHKKSDKRDGGHSETEKKKKHKRQPSVASTKDWQNGEECSEADGSHGTLQITSNVKAPNEKGKPKNLRRRFPFGKAKHHKKKEQSATEDKYEIFLDEPAPHPNKGEQSNEQITDEIEIRHRDVGQSGGSPEDGVEAESVCPELTTDGVPQDVTSNVSSETQETTPESLNPVQTCPAEEDTIPKPESPTDQEDKIVPAASTAILWEVFMHLKELMVNNEKLQSVDEVDVISTTSQYEIYLYKYDFGLAKVLAFWSFLLSRASETSRQILVYCICSLIKRYPHCFKIQLKAAKQQRIKEAANEVSAQMIKEYVIIDSK